MHHIQLSNKKTGLLNYLFLLTLFFVLLEISLFIQGREIYLSDFKLVASHLRVPLNVIPGVLYFLFIQVLVHVSFVLLIWSLAHLVGVALKLSSQKIDQLGFRLWILGIITVLLANHYFFPNSKFATLIDYIIHFSSIADILFYISLGLMLSILIVALRGLWLVAPYIVLSACGLISAIFAIHFTFLPQVIDASTNEKPNIIIIGIDSLRPDFLGYFGYEKQTPHLDQFLNRSTVFADSLTPLARTFPAWVSILSGEYPKKNRIRFDLASYKNANWHETLPNQLREQGYEAIFATDETRFSNIDTTYGFDKTLNPPIGFNDFLLGNLNDFPLSNLLVNTMIGKYFFPHSYANRPVFNTYDPDSFIRFLQPELNRPRTKPLFFAVHFCLPHFPYIWGGFSENDNFLRNYQASIHRVDRQFYDFMQLLEKDKLLEHAIVIVLSDHGEALEMHGDRVTNADLFIPGQHNHAIPHFYPPTLDSEAIDESAGHGTDVLGLSQYHTVLAFRLYGTVSHPGMVSQRVSLLDIKPTILDFLRQRPSSKDDGTSLKKFVLGKEVARSSSTHDFFMESDFSPQAVRTVHPETHALLFQGIDYFQIDPVTARICVKDSMAKLIISSKQYADIYGDWILALYPQNKKAMIPILVNLRNGQWTNDLHTSFAQSSPAEHMLQALKQFYGNDILI